MEEHVYLTKTKTPIKDCCAYVQHYFDEISPFQINDGYYFQIRMNADTYNHLHNEYKNELIQFSIIGGQTVEDVSVWNRYITDHFWLYTQEYIFNFHVRNAIRLQTKCIFGPEALEESASEMIFIDSSALTPFILHNIGLESNNPPNLSF